MPKKKVRCLQRFLSLTGAIVLCINFSCKSADSPEQQKPLKAPYSEIVQTGIITNLKLRECSGIAASRRTRHLLWMINDGGNGSVLFAVNQEGDVLQEIAINNAQNFDWEDLASFELNGKSYLLIADVGDNSSKRSFCTLYFIEEPEIAKNDAKAIPIAGRLDFQYQDGPHDCESVAVDVFERKIYLITKRAKPPGLYFLSLSLSHGNEMLTAKKAGEIPFIPPATEKEQKAKNLLKTSQQPTAMDIDSAGRMAILLTYNNAYYYKKNQGQSWAEAFSLKPAIIELPLLPQSEAVCLSTDGNFAYITTEIVPAPILQVKLNGN